MRPTGYHHTEETKKKISQSNRRWNKGLTKEVDDRLRKQSDTLSKHWQNTPHPKGMLGKHHTEETKKKMSNNRKGDLNAHWKGGLTSEYYLHHTSPEWNNRRKECYQRDNYTCRICGKKGTTDVPLDALSLQSHHIIPWHISHDDSLSNLITCCLSCHRKIEGKPIGGIKT
jgi:hypothetical protein